MSQHEEKVLESFENVLGRKLPKNCKITVTVEHSDGELDDASLAQVSGGALTQPTLKSTALFNFSGTTLTTDFSGLRFGDLVSASW